MNIFEQASRKKLSFKMANGVIKTDDLWDLNLESLDKIAIALNKEIKNSDEGSFLAKKTTANTTLNLQFEIVIHIITVKQEEQERKKLTKERAEKRAQLKELIEKKVRNAQEEKSIEELERELAELDEV
jgi:hypothetical protein